MIHNLAKRAHDHNYRFDPIIRSLLDTDFYKLLMLQLIWERYPDTEVTFSLMNRSQEVLLAEEIDEVELRRQLDHARSLAFTNSELIWLAGNSFYKTRGIFRPEFIEWLRDFRLPPYLLAKKGGQWSLSFSGPWCYTTLWEIPALAIVSELRSRALYASMSEFDLDILFARAKVRMWEKIERLRGIPGLTFTDFGTRRRASFLWQDYVVDCLKNELPGQFLGTSNTLIAMRHDLEAMGTNAHELQMVAAALERPNGRPEALRRCQYDVLTQWADTYHGALRIILPDTWGTTQFLQGAPAWVADWTGIRIDSKSPVAAGEEYIAWLNSRGIDPRSKLLLFSDGLDVDEMVQLYARFGGTTHPGRHEDSVAGAKDFADPSAWSHEPRIRVSFGWGTLLTNDFRQCHPREDDLCKPISLVCKVSEVNGVPAVKLSDNPLKATGPADEVAYYRSVFGFDGVSTSPILV